MTRPTTRRGRLLTAFRDRSRPAGGTATPIEGLEIAYLETVRQLGGLARIGARVADGPDRLAWGWRHYVATALGEAVDADFNGSTTAHLEEIMRRLAGADDEED